jgi:hypothetical protein
MLHWKPEWDLRLLVIALKFRNKAGFVSWAMAKANGYLRNLPKLSSRDFSHRLSHLLCIKFNPEGLERKKQLNKKYLQLNKKYLPKQNRVSFVRRLKIFQKDLSENTRKRYGHNPREKWTKDQRKILFYLAEKYRKSPVTIDWRKLVKDEVFYSLPSHKLAQIRSYYWRLKRPPDPKKRRKQAIAYKYKNYGKYLSNQRKASLRVRDSVNDFLMDKLELQ